MVSNGRLRHHHFGTPLPCGFNAASSERGSPFHSLGHIGCHPSRALVETGNLTAPSLRPSLPLRPLVAVCAPFFVGAWLRRVAVGDSSALFPACARVAGFLSSLSSAVVLQPPLASRRSAMAAVVHRFRSGWRGVSLGGISASALRIGAASLRHAVCGILPSHGHAHAFA